MGDALVKQKNREYTLTKDIPVGSPFLIMTYADDTAFFVSMAAERPSNMLVYLRVGVSAADAGRRGGNGQNKLSATEMP